MSKREVIARFGLIIKKLRKHPADFKEINDYLQLESEIQGYNFVASKRTFDRDTKEIASLYNIEIVYDYYLRKYKIESELEPEANERILEAFDTFNALNLTDRLSEYIHFENRRPKGTENLYGILHAIKNRLQLRFNYQGFWSDSPENRKINPLALKEFNNRWYIISIDLKDRKIKSFALDRLSDLEITKIIFEYPETFNVSEYYKDCFGIMSPNAEKPESVILSFVPNKGKYIKSLPLHKSQQILVDDENELRISLRLYVTHDFIMEILSHGDEVKVIEPQSLAEEIKGIYKGALKKY